MSTKFETNITNKHNIVKNLNWQEANYFAIYKASAKGLNPGPPRTNPACGKEGGEGGLNPGPPEYKTTEPHCLRAK